MKQSTGTGRSCRVLCLCASSFGMAWSAWGVNVEKDVAAAATDLGVAAAYAPAALPATTNDITFRFDTTYANASSLIVSTASISLGSLNDLNTTTLTVSGRATAGANRTITLYGGGDTIGGSTSTDLIFLPGSANLTIQNATGGSTLGLTLAADGDFDVGSAAALTIGGALTGNFNLRKTGAGALTLAGVNTFGAAKTFELKAGTANINSSTALGAATDTFQIDDGATINNTSGAAITLANNQPLALNGNVTFTGATDGTHDLNLGTGTVGLGGATRTITASAGTLTLAGILSNGGIVKTGAGALTLKGANTFGGGLTIKAGTVTAATSTSSLGGSGTGAVYLGDTSGSANATLNGYGATLANPITVQAGSSGNTLTIGNGGGGSASVFSGLVTLNTNVSLATGTGSVKLSGKLTGTGTISATGAGTLTLEPAANDSDFSGGVTLGSGTTLNINKGASLGAAAGVLTINGGTINNTVGSTVIVANNNAQNWNGDIAFSGSNPLNLGAGAVTMNATRQVTVSASTLTVGGIISGSACGLTKAGAGTLVLGNAANTYSGATTIGSGTLSVGNIVVGAGASGLGNASTAVALGSGLGTNGTLSYTGGSATCTRGFNLNAGGGEVDVTTAGQTLTIDTTGITGSGLLTFGGAGNITVTSAGAIASSGGLTLSSTGTNTLSAANTYTGPTTLNGGTIIVGDSNAFGSGSSPISITTSCTLQPTTSLTLANNWTMGAYLTLVGTNNVALNGTITLSGANGATQRLRYDSLTGGAGVTLGGNIYLSDSPSTGHTFEPYGVSAINTLTINSTIADYNGVGGTAGTLMILPGQVTLNGLNTYSGTTIISGSGAAAYIASFGSPGVPGNLGEGTLIQIYGAIYYQGGGETNSKSIDMYSAGKGATIDTTGASGGLILTGGATASSTGAHILTLKGNTAGNEEQGAIVDGSGTNSITKSGSGTWKLSGANTYSGKTSINAGGILSVASLNSVNGGTPLFASSSLGAPTNVANGTIGFYNQLLAGEGPLATLLYTGPGETTDRIIDFAGTTDGTGGVIDQSGAGLVKFTSSLTCSANATHLFVLQGSTTGSGEIAGAIVNGSTHLTSLTKAGNGLWTLSGSNVYSGATTVSNGVLLLNSAFALPGGIGSGGGISSLSLNGGVVGLGNGDFSRGLGTATNQVQFAAPGGGFAAYGANRVVNLGGASAPCTWGSGSFVPAGGSLLLGAGSADHLVDFQDPIVLNSNACVQVDDGAATVDARLSGVLSGTNLTKTGLGTLELTNTNTYKGATVLSAGTLLVNGSLANTSLTVGAAATLGGTGVVAGVTTVQTGGILAPGGTAAVGTLTFSNLALQAGTVYNWEYSSATGDLVTVQGSLTLPLVATVNVTRISGGLPSKAVLFTCPNTVTADLSRWVVNYTGTPSGQVTASGANVVLAFPIRGMSVFFR